MPSRRALASVSRKNKSAPRQTVRHQRYSKTLHSSRSSRMSISPLSTPPTPALPKSTRVVPVVGSSENANDPDKVT